MARKTKDVTWETDYVEKVKLLNEMVAERIAFLTTFRFPGYEDTNVVEGNTSGVAGQVSGNSNEEKAWNFFASKGFTAAAAAGVLGNLRQESGIDPRKTQYGGGPGTGLCQWEKGGRWDSLVKWAKKERRDEWDISTQLDFLWYELNGGDPTTKSLLNKNWGGIDGLRSATDYQWAVDAFEKSFERAGKPNLPQRYQYAKEFLDRFGQGNGSQTAGLVNYSSNARGDARKVIELAEAWLSKSNVYTFGGGRSEAHIKAGKFDCSSFCNYIFRQAGYQIMGHNELWGNTDTVIGNKKLKIVSTADLQPGDLVFYHTYKINGHIAIYLGGGKSIGTQSSTGIAVIDQTQGYWKDKLATMHRRVL